MRLLKHLSQSLDYASRRHWDVETHGQFDNEQVLVVSILSFLLFLMSFVHRRSILRILI